MGRLLFFTPVLPALSGQGSAIRAGIALELLAERHEVTVVQFGLWAGHPGMQAGPWLRRHAAAYHLIPASGDAGAAQRLFTEHLSAVRWDAVYVFRLAAAPLALQMMGLLGGKLPNALDMDDDECSRTEKFIPLREAAGDLIRAGRERAELGKLRMLQRMLLARFDLSLLAADEDRIALAARYPDKRFAWLPNVVRIPAERATNADRQPASLLFLGTLDYLPNEDAVLHFCADILPLLRAGVPDAKLRVVGIQAPESIRTLHGAAGVTVVGAVLDVAPEYARAALMVVPIRAGSGTRIKILEAFSYGLPVVSTTMGAAGLNVKDGEQLLLADTPETFATACRRLIEDPAMAAELAANAKEWLRETHSLERVRPMLHGLFPES